MTDIDEPRTKSKRRNILLIAAALVVAALVLFWIMGQEDEEEAPARQAVAVEVVEVGTRTLEETVRGIGTLRAFAEVEISSEVAGRVQRLGFTEGSAVDEGDVLVELDAGKARSQLAANQAALESARVRVTNLERSFERQQRLVEQALVSQEEFEQVRTELDSARAEVERLQAEVQLTRERLQDTVIRASFAGSISERLVDPGGYVSPGEVIARLYSLDPLEIAFSIPERFAAQVSLGQPVTVTTAAFPDRSFRGEVSFVNPAIDEQTRTLPIKARVPNPDNELKPGAFATALVTVGQRENQPVLPSEALVATRSGYMVFVVEEGRAVSRNVQTGLRSGNAVEIMEGLNPGELVVRSGHMRLDPGMPVEVVDSLDRSSETQE
ncbi:efflux RND transporter periplasmic adaptor subunit [Gilvimarinus sp. F26214L]|uniref:efflux RND transporter periplasmic adaptor subunit n=1 Tax=Gilvimarinus sp. DZF01 TaxID=3461371 RepID=UPI004045C312